MVGRLDMARMEVWVVGWTTGAGELGHAGGGGGGVLGTEVWEAVSRSVVGKRVAKGVFSVPMPWRGRGITQHLQLSYLPL